MTIPFGQTLLQVVGIEFLKLPQDRTINQQIAVAAKYKPFRADLLHLIYSDQVQTPSVAAGASGQIVVALFGR